MEVDWVRITRLFQDEDFMVFSPNGVWVAASAIARFWEIQKHAQNYAYAKMAILFKENIQIIGYCGFEQWFWMVRKQLNWDFACSSMKGKRAI